MSNEQYHSSTPLLPGLLYSYIPIQSQLWVDRQYPVTVFPSSRVTQVHQCATSPGHFLKMNLASWHVRIECCPSFYSNRVRLYFFGPVFIYSNCWHWLLWMVDGSNKMAAVVESCPSGFNIFPLPSLSAHHNTDFLERDQRN